MRKAQALGEEKVANPKLSMVSESPAKNIQTDRYVMKWYLQDRNGRKYRIQQALTNRGSTNVECVIDHIQIEVSKEKLRIKLA